MWIHAGVQGEGAGTLLRGRKALLMMMAKEQEEKLCCTSTFQIPAHISLAKEHHRARVKGKDVSSVSSSRIAVTWQRVWIRRQVKNCGHLFNLPYLSSFYLDIDLSGSNDTLAQLIPQHSLAQRLASFK